MPDDSRSLRVRAHAKLNLLLRVLAREQSGFHQIETIFCGIELADELDLALRGDVVSLDVEGQNDAGSPPNLGPEHSNLAWRAATMFNEAAGLYGAHAGVHIRLRKRVPSGAGLGGGSSDAAAVLAGLNRLHGSPLGPDELCSTGARLGSDVPFFLTGEPLVLAWGRGDRMLPLRPLPPAEVLLAVPSETVPTIDAYAALAHVRAGISHELLAGLTAEQGNAVRRRTQSGPALLAAPQSWTDIDAISRNDFEDIIFHRLPVQAQIRDALAELGGAPARLTGTGSVVYGIFETGIAAERAHRRMADAFPAVTFLRTRTMGGAAAPVPSPA